jgi:hypothetical protein
VAGAIVGVTLSSVSAGFWPVYAACLLAALIGLLAPVSTRPWPLFAGVVAVALFGFTLAFVALVGGGPILALHAIPIVMIGGGTVLVFDAAW